MEQLGLYEIIDDKGVCYLVISEHSRDIETVINCRVVIANLLMLGGITNEVLIDENNKIKDNTNDLYEFKPVIVARLGKLK